MHGTKITGIAEDTDPDPDVEVDLDAGLDWHGHQLDDKPGN
jgi:hypothetical protein